MSVDIFNISMENEVWSNVVIEGKVHPWYSVSNYGNVVSHIVQKVGGNRGGSWTDYSPLYRKQLKPTMDRYSYVDMRFPFDFFEDYEYTTSGKKTIKRKRYVHQLVMETFRPMDQFPPEKLKECWECIPTAAKQWIRQTITINHVDHNPYNNRLDNLEYTSQKGNSHAAVKHYISNDKKKSEEECPINIIEPVYNHLLQEYENDGDTIVEFIGEEGEKYYNMFMDIAKEHDESVDDAFCRVIRESCAEMLKQEEGVIE